MVEAVSSSEFDRRHDLPDWRILLGRIETSFTTGSFAAAADLVAAIAAAADDAGHHPDVDLRYPDRVHVVVATHAGGPGWRLTAADADLAQRISRLAAERGAAGEPVAAQTLEIAIDALDIEAVRPFWQAVLAYEPVPSDDGAVRDLVDPQRIGPAVWFQQMDAPRPQRNRFHLDVTVPHDVAASRVDAALAAGGTLLTAEHARAFWVLADAEGNEACVCTWLDRD